MMFLYLDTLAIVCAWAFLAIKEKKLTLKWHWMYIPMLVFLGSLILSTIFSIDVHTSIFGYYGRFNGGLLSIFVYFALFFVLVQVANKQFIINLLKCAFLTAVGTVLIGLPGRVGLDTLCFVFTGHLTNACWTDQFRPAERMFSTLGQPNWLGAYLAINFFIGLWFLVKRDYFKNRSTYVLLSAIVLVFLGVLFSRSRSALLGVVTGLALFSSGLWFIEREKITKNLTLVGIVAVVLLASVFIFKTGIDKVDSILSFSRPITLKESTSSATPSAIPASNVTESFDIRKIVWEGAIALGNRYPLFGTGVETFAYSYYFTRPIAHNYTSEWDFLYNKAHNEYLNYLATTGYVGLSAYLAMIGSFIGVFLMILMKKSKKTDTKILTLAVVSSYATILVTNFFGFSVSNIQIFFYILPAIVLGYAISAKLKGYEFEVKLADLMTKVWKGVIITLFTLGVIYLGRYYFADIRYATADIYARSGDYSTAYELYQQALVLRYEHVYEDKYSSSLANLAFLASSENDKKLSEALIELSNKYNGNTLKAAPKNVLYWKTQAKNMYIHFQTTLDKKYLLKAIQAMGEAKKLSPTDPKLAYSQALFYSLMYDESKTEADKLKYKAAAFQEVNLSLALKKDFDDSLTLMKSLKEKFKEEDQ